MEEAPELPRLLGILWSQEATELLTKRHCGRSQGSSFQPSSQLREKAKSLPLAFVRSENSRGKETIQAFSLMRGFSEVSPQNSLLCPLREEDTSLRHQP